MKPERLFVWASWKDYKSDKYIVEVPYAGADLGVVVWSSRDGPRWLGRDLNTAPTYLWRVVPLVPL